MRPDVFDLPEPVDRSAYDVVAETLRSLREQVAVATVWHECGLDETWQILRAKRGSRR